MIVSTLRLFDPLSGFKTLALLLCTNANHIMIVTPPPLQTRLKLDFGLGKHSNFALPSLNHYCYGGRSLTEVGNEPSFVLLAYILGSLYLAQSSQYQRIHSSPNALFSTTHTLCLFTNLFPQVWIASYHLINPHCPHPTNLNFQINLICYVNSPSTLTVGDNYFPSGATKTEHISQLLYIPCYIIKFMRAFHAPLVVFELPKIK